VPFAKVGLLTNGYGQNHNELIAFGPAREAVELLVSMLKETRWDVFEVTSVPVDSPSVMALQTAAAEAGVTVHTEVGVASPFISLERSWESFLLGRSSNFRSDMRRKWNKCTEAGLVLEEVTSVSEVDAALAEILQIEELSWKQQAGTSISVQELAIRFYRSFIPKAASEGWLRIFLARLEGRAIAYDMGVQLHGKYYMLKTGYDDRYGALSPGTFVRQHVMKCLFAEGAIEHDFLGDADAYKLRWTSSQRMHLHLYLWNATRWRSRAYLLAKRLHAARAIGQKSLKVLA
jgi:CelD/BcsL family acetyltransferase involved in cellulose biosynthesis